MPTLTAAVQLSGSRFRLLADLEGTVVDPAVDRGIALQLAPNTQDAISETLSFLINGTTTVTISLEATVRGLYLNLPVCLVLTMHLTVPVAQASPSPVTISQLLHLGTSSPVRVQLTNAGNSNLQINSVTLQG